MPVWTGGRCEPSRRQVVPHQQNQTDIPQRQKRVLPFDGTFGQIWKLVDDPDQQFGQFEPRQPHELRDCQHSHRRLHRSRPRQSRPSGGGPSAPAEAAASRATGTKWRSASPPKREALAAISRRTAPHGRKQGRDWRGGVGKRGADWSAWPAGRCRNDGPRVRQLRVFAQTAVVLGHPWS